MFVMGLIVVLSFLWSYRYWHGMHIVKPKVFPLVENTNNETINNVWKAARNGKLALMFCTLGKLVVPEFMTLAKR